MVLSTLAQVLAVSGGLMTPVAMPVSCRITQAPIINIRPQTNAIVYDSSKTSQELTTFKLGTISPYGLNVDQTTGGLRHDRPKMSYSIKYNVATDVETGTFCLSYNTINVDIVLSPHIYIAKEYDVGECGQMVRGHEKKHVTVDRWIMNKYANQMGLAIQTAVNSAGAIGPYPAHRRDEMQEVMEGHIESALASIRLNLKNEMNTRQQHVDSLEEYERVSGYCRESATEVFRKIREEKKSDGSK